MLSSSRGGMYLCNCIVMKQPPAPPPQSAECSKHLFSTLRNNLPLEEITRRGEGNKIKKRQHIAFSLSLSLSLT